MGLAAVAWSLMPSKYEAEGSNLRLSGVGIVKARLRMGVRWLFPA